MEDGQLIDAKMGRCMDIIDVGWMGGKEGGREGKQINRKLGRPMDGRTWVLNLSLPLIAAKSWASHFLFCLCVKQELWLY